MYEDEDVVDADSKNKERNDFDDDQSRWDAQVTEETDTRGDGQQHDDDATETEHHFRIDLKHVWLRDRMWQFREI